MPCRRARGIEALALARRCDEVAVVVRLELVRVGVDRREVADAVVARPGLEDAVKGERAQRREAAGTAAADRHALAVDPPLRSQVARAGDAVLDVDDAPLA